jgi:hypothetical protein
MSLTRSNELDAASRNTNKKELAEKHLFCSLLAAVFCEVQQLSSNIDIAVDHITASNVDGRAGLVASQLRGAGRDHGAVRLAALTALARPAGLSLAG